MTQPQQAHTPIWKWVKAKTLRHLHIREQGAIGGVNMSVSPEYDDIAQLIASAPTLRADNARMRKALHIIGYEPIGHSMAGAGQVLNDIVNIARAALAQSAENEATIQMWVDELNSIKDSAAGLDSGADWFDVECQFDDLIGKMERTIG